MKVSYINPYYQKKYRKQGYAHIIAEEIIFEILNIMNLQLTSGKTDKHPQNHRIIYCKYVLIFEIKAPSGSKPDEDHGQNRNKSEKKYEHILHKT